jgi:hypothetical protein
MEKRIEGFVMKITFTHKNKAYSVSYRQLNENEPLQIHTSMKCRFVDRFNLSI